MVVSKKAAGSGRDRPSQEGLKDAGEIRRDNMRYLAEKFGGRSKFARKLDMSPSYLSQIIGPNPVRGIGNRLARRIEELVSLERGWLDYQHSNVEIQGRNIKITRIPVLGDSESGARKQRRGEVGMHVEAVSNDLDAYALQVKGSDLEPRMYDEEYIVVEPNTAPEPGDEVVINLKKGGVLIKRIIGMDDSVIRFSNLNGSGRESISLSKVRSVHYVMGVFKAKSLMKN